MSLRAGARLLAIAAAVAGAGAPAVAGAAPVTYRLDPAHTFVTFEVRHFGTSTLRGRLGPVEGEVVLDPPAGRGEVRLTIPLATLDTGVRVLDARLKAPDLLAAEAHPVAWFVATDFRFAPDGAVRELRGELTVRDVGTGVSLVAERFACRDDARLGRRVCGGDFTGEVRRSAFGATYGLPFIEDRVRLVVQVEGIATDEPR